MGGATVRSRINQIPFGLFAVVILLSLFGSLLGSLISAYLIQPHSAETRRGAGLAQMGREVPDLFAAAPQTAAPGLIMDRIRHANGFPGLFGVWVDGELWFYFPELNWLTRSEVIDLDARRNLSDRVRERYDMLPDEAVRDVQSGAPASLSSQGSADMPKASHEKDQAVAPPASTVDTTIDSSSNEKSLVVDVYKRVSAMIPDDWTVMYPATGPQRATITVFTDVTCPFCRKLHAQMDELRAGGLTVRYMLYPRKGADSIAAQRMSKAWCSPNRASAMNLAFEGRDSEIDESASECAAPIERQMNIAQELGITGTPFILSSTGVIVEGFVPAKDLLSAIGITVD